MAVSFGCQIPSRGSPDSLRKLAHRAEELAFDSVWLIDHIVIPRTVTSVYPYSPDGVSTFDPDQAILEPLTGLSFLAACTQRVRLGTAVLIIPYRPPLFTAKMLAMIDVLSGGRLTLGAGVGWMAEEFDALGLGTFAERGAVTDEYLRLFKELWTKESPSFQGKYVQVDNVAFLPKPVQQPHPPIWVGGHTRPALRRAAALGDGWFPLGTFPPAVFDPSTLQGMIASLRRLTRQAGRPEGAVTVCFGGSISFESTSDAAPIPLRGHPEKIADDLRNYQAVGVQNFVLWFRAAGPSEQLEAMERFSREVMPLVPS